MARQVIKPGYRNRQEECDWYEPLEKFGSIQCRHGVFRCKAPQAGAPLRCPYWWPKREKDVEGSED